MSTLAANVTGDRYPGLGICHGPECGAPMPPEIYGYCSEHCRAEARRLALAGVPWKPHPNFAAAVRHAATAERHPGAGRSVRTKQRKAKAATTAT